MMFSSFTAIVPMCCVVATAIAAMVAEAFREPGERMPIGPLGAIGLVGAGIASAALWNSNATSFGVVVADNFGLFITWILIVVGLLSLVFSAPTIEREEDHQQIRRGRHQHHAGERKQHQRVVLALRQPFARDRGRRNRERQHADHDQNPGDEQAEVIGNDEAEARLVVIPECDGCDRRDGSECRDRREGREGRKAAFCRVVLLAARLVGMELGAFLVVTHVSGGETDETVIRGKVVGAGVPGIREWRDVHGVDG